MAKERVFNYRNVGTEASPVWEKWFQKTIADAVLMSDSDTETKTIVDYVNEKVAGLLGTATPETLDTLKEIADWITAHEEVATALNTAIAGKAEKDHIHAAATQTVPGFLSAADKKKLDGVASGAQVNVIEKVVFNGTELPVSSKSVSIQAVVAADLAAYYTATQVDQKVSAIPKFSIQAVETLPTTGISNTTVYLLKSGEESQNLYTEYIRVGSTWEKLGTQTVDLTDYVTKQNAISGATKKNNTTITFTRADGTTFDVTITGTVYTHPSSHPASMITQDATHRFATDTEKAAWNAKANIYFGSALPSTAPAGSVCFLIG